MIALSLAEIATATDGRVEQDVRGTAVVGAVAIDSRAVEVGGLFVAIAGEHVDGHDFVDQAVANGAAAVLATLQTAAPTVVVADTVAALGRLAAFVRRRLAGCVVVAITGSQGKTGVKDIVAQLLDSTASTVATTGNLNNEIGVPLTVLRADETTSYLVVEMGARSIGNIAYLCDIARPDIGVVLNVGTAHLGEFGSQRAIATAKGELVESLSPSGTAILNADDPLVLEMAERTHATVVTFGEAVEADVRVADVALDSSGEPSLRLVHGTESVDLHLPLLGRHQVSNAAAAAAVALASGRGLVEVGRDLAAVGPLSTWRMERHVRPDGVMVVNDAYNANPDSMGAALHTLASLSGAGARRTVAVLGEMLELGASSVDAHASIGTLAAGLEITAIVVVGDSENVVAIAAAAGRGGASVTTVLDAAAATTWLDRFLESGDVVLVKASRAAGLERVATALLATSGDTSRDHDDEGNDAR